MNRFSSCFSHYIALISCVMFLPVSVQAATIINPHTGEHCNGCHVKLPERSSGDSMEYNFLAEEIDPTCMVCHGMECCSIGGKHRTHPSGIDQWDHEKFAKPEKLPLNDGYITCVTCHFWRRELNRKTTDYKLVRIVNISETHIDWTDLCLDCHIDY